MKTLSVYTKEVEPYEAGIDIAEKVKKIDPEILIIFPSIHYKPFEDLLEAIYDEIDNENLIIIGGTGDGFIEKEISANYGVGVLAINSEGSIKWNIDKVDNIFSSSFEAGKKIANNLLKRDPKMKLMILFSDGMTGDGVKLIEGVKKVTSTPVVGGATGDDHRFEEGYIFYNREAKRDSVVALSISGDFNFAISTASGWIPFGESGIIDDVDQKVVKSISGIKTVDFIKNQLKVESDDIEMALFPLAIYSDDGNFFMRSAFKWDYETKEIAYAGTIKNGKKVRVSYATIEDILYGVNRSIDPLKNIKFIPKAAVVFTCAARKWILGGKQDMERVILNQYYPIEFAGFPSFGEIGPFRKGDNSYSETFFHNKTYILLLLGD